MAPTNNREANVKHPAMCPECGWLFDHRGGLVPSHTVVDTQADDPLYSKVVECPGTEQNPRNPRADRRPLWNGQPNPHVDANGLPLI